MSFTSSFKIVLCWPNLIVSYIHYNENKLGLNDTFSYFSIIKFFSGILVHFSNSDVKNLESIKKRDSNIGLGRLKEIFRVEFYYSLFILCCPTIPIFLYL